jgi:hypothetical protein
LILEDLSAGDSGIQDITLTKIGFIEEKKISDGSKQDFVTDLYNRLFNGKCPCVGVKISLIATVKYATTVKAI